MPELPPEMGIGQIAASKLLLCDRLSVQETLQNELLEKTTRASLEADKEWIHQSMSKILYEGLYHSNKVSLYYILI